MWLLMCTLYVVNSFFHLLLLKKIQKIIFNKAGVFVSPSIEDPSPNFSPPLRLAHQISPPNRRTHIDADEVLPPRDAAALLNLIFGGKRS